MSEISDLYSQIEQQSPKLIKKWQLEINKRIRRFVRNIAKASPFLDKPVKRMFGVRNNMDGKSLTIYGTAPNAGRMKSFNAPVNQWQETRKTFRIYGRDGWRTIHKTQLFRKNAGTEIADVPYFGTSEKPVKYFGIKKGRIRLAYGKTTDNGLALPVYADNTYPDWIMENHKEEIDRIIIEAGRDILSQALFANQL